MLRCTPASCASGLRVRGPAESNRTTTPGMRHMSFKARIVGNATVVDVDGQLIVGNRHELKRLVLEELEGGARRFVIDFARTGYIDSSGLGILISLSKRVRELGGELRLASLSEELQRLFELTKLHTLFEIRDSLEQALSD
ncbi:MAG: STAS domain-containing protein [Gemmatimonadetes bacterium]|nr:STAS domain-containing protein [Gemmatimonadota bacterium]MXX70432.1 STAS domain-containing protein [Gemmatimonadota bacterium]MYC90639.1 STAS domain-containing protein [Gemmatimonadota bacterium]MYG36788.1 STAS domain-containing protein [Gemmatimonadota bacterium]